MAEAIRVEVVGLLNPAPGDVVVCRAGAEFPAQDLDVVRAELARLFPDNVVAFLPDGWELAVADGGLAARLNALCSGRVDAAAWPDARKAARPHTPTLGVAEPGLSLADGLLGSDADVVVEAKP